MAKGFWDFMSDWMTSTAFSYRETDEKHKGRKYIKLIRNNKEMVVDVDDYEILEGEEIKLIR